MVAAAISTDRVIRPSFINAFPHFLPIAVFPLMFAAAAYGGWWIAGPFLFFLMVGPFDLALGLDGRNMDPRATSEDQLGWYNLPVWAWAVLWPAVFVFTLWQIFMVGELALWESILLAIMLGLEGQGVFIVGHELIHRRASRERFVGEFLLASASYPHYATEHFYIHHAYVGTPRDVGSAPKGQSFWEYLPSELASNLLGAWRVERERMAHRRLPVWHVSNSFWRYGAETAVWYAFVYLMGGWWAVLIYLILCFGTVFSMKISNYLQHYGLRRIRLPNGRFERVGARHSWNADYRFSNWMFFNMQRHPDHHVSAGRRYPLLQYHGEDESPQLPGSYGTMFGLVVRPKRFFRTMDPLVDQWRAHFYPEIKDWRPYDSAVSEARPEAFDAIVEIYASAPRLAQVIERDPDLLDSLQDREFTNLEIPDGFGQDSEFESIARRGLVRVYWTHEFGVVEMKEQLAEVPAKDAADAAEIARNWTNNKTFQVAMHTIRGNLTPVEAGIALANIAESSIDAVLQAVVEDVSDQKPISGKGGIAAILLGDLASREVAPCTPLEIRFVYEGDSHQYRTLCHRFHEALGRLTRNSLLFAPYSGKTGDPVMFTRDEFVQHFRNESAGALRDLTRARCIFTNGETGVAKHFEEARRSLLASGPAREALLRELREGADDSSESDPSLAASLKRGMWSVERVARIVQLTNLEKLPGSLITGSATSVLQAGQELGLIPGEATESLIGSATMLRNLHGIVQLILEDGKLQEELPEPVRQIMVRACGMEDWDALVEAVGAAANVIGSGLVTIPTPAP